MSRLEIYLRDTVLFGRKKIQFGFYLRVLCETLA